MATTTPHPTTPALHDVADPRLRATVSDAARPVATRRIGPLQRARRLVALAVVSATATLALAGAVAPGVADAATPPAAGAKASLPTWQVTITGTASGNPFRLTGQIYLARRVTNVTQNGLNPYELCLKVGFPAGAPQTGAIWFGSNSACFGSRAAIDTVFASASGTTYTAQPDRRLTSAYLNNWTARGGITACPYSASSGVARFSFSGSSVRGSLDLSGYGGAFCGWSTYRATVSGVRVA